MAKIVKKNQLEAISASLEVALHYSEENKSSALDFKELIDEMFRNGDLTLIQRDTLRFKMADMFSASHIIERSLMCIKNELETK